MNSNPTSVRPVYRLTAILALASALTVRAAENTVSADRTVSEPYPIDLPTTLRLVLRQNHQVQLAEQQVKQAQARWRQAQYQLIPTLRLGASYYYQDGPLQETDGTTSDIKRSGAYAGLGAGAVGAGLTSRPGVSVEADLGQAIYGPLAAKQAKLATEAGSQSARHRESLAAVRAFYELMQAKARLAVFEDALRMYSDLSDLTEQFAASGAGLQSDAERAAVEKLLAESQQAQGTEDLRLASLQLSRILRLDPGTQLFPLGELVPIEFVPANQSEEHLVSLALAARPEIRMHQALVAEAQHRVHQAKYAPLLPKLAAGVSVGGFGGDTSSAPGSLDERVDFGGMIFWELKGLGFGNRQRRQERTAQLAEARIQQDDQEYGIRTEVAAALARVNTTRGQIELTEAATERARKSYDFNRSLVFEQKGLPIETLQAIHSLTTARQRHLQAVAAQNTAQFQLYTAIGQPDSRSSTQAQPSEPPITPTQKPKVD